MSRKPNPVPVPQHMHQGDIDVRASKSKMRRTKKFKEALTVAMRAGWTDGQIDRALHPKRHGDTDQVS